MRVVLASSSPRRIELLKSIFSTFEIIVPESLEIHDSLIHRDQLVQQNAINKLWDVWSRIPVEPLLVIAADTLVYSVEGHVLGKPSNQKEAIAYLAMLSGVMHYVATGVAMAMQTQISCVMKSFAEISTVHFNQLDLASITNYVNTCQPYDKAGAYGIQELPDSFVNRVEGSFHNIIGLPTERLIKELKSLYQVLNHPWDTGTF